MRKFVAVLLMLFTIPSVYAWNWDASFAINMDELAVRKLLASQIKYANKTNFKKFIATYDKTYQNSDGFDLKTYSNIVRETWDTSETIKYAMKIKNIKIQDNYATAELSESSGAQISSPEKLSGEFKSFSNSICKLKKENGKWKVVSDSILDEITYMLYGDARNLEIELCTPNNIVANAEYTASLEFIPPKDTLAIASITSEPITYPQKREKEVFRALPDNHILERFFTANDKNFNEYIIASIGLTKSEISEINIKLSLTGYGYAIKRVNVVPQTKGDDSNVQK